MTLQQLRYFAALAKVLHFTRTAAELRISQPSLSYSVSEMEKELGVQLFDKKDGKIALSVHGERFLPFVEESLRIIDEGILKIKRETSPASGTVRLGYFYSISSTVIPILVDNFFKENADADISFNFAQDLNDNLINDLKNGKLDLAFCVEKSDGISSIPLAEQELFLIVSSKHRLAKHSKLSIHEFANEPLIMLHKNSGIRKMTEQIFAKYKYSPVPAFEGAECNAVVQYVLLGRGVAIIPKIPAMDSPSIKTIKIKEKDFRRTIYISWNESTILPPAKRVLNYITKTFAALPPD